MKKLFYILTLAVALSSCKKENNAMEFKGKYVGTFKSMMNGGELLVIPAELNLAKPNFELAKGAKPGNGTFKVEDKMNITFNDINVWTADFNWNLILSGTYTYKAQGDSLILTKKFTDQNPSADSYYYQYRLKRVRQ